MGQSQPVSTVPWPKIVVVLVALFALSTGAGYAVGAQVQGPGGAPVAAPPVTTRATEAPTTTAPPTTEAPTTAAAPTTTTTEATTTTTEAGPRRPDREHPLRIMMAGDSVMAGLVPPVKAALEADGTSVVRFSLTPSILRDPTVRFNWNQQLSEFDPEVIVMFVGTWESGVVQNLNGQSVDRPGWRATYEQTVLDPWIQLITSRGASVIWVGNPVVGNADANHAFVALNAAFRDLPARWPDVTYLDSDPALNGGAVGFNPVVVLADGTRIRTRQTDGLHLCPGGAALLGRALTEQIATGFKASVAKDWASGSWTADPVYPPASCPAP